MMRRALIGLAVLAVLGAGVLLTFRSRSPVDPSANFGTSDIPEDAIPRTSDSLIADALKAGELTYEESLLQRAYAIFDDPRLAPLYRSPIPNWDDMATLLHEVDAKEASLGADLLSALAPFRVRPNDPISIVNRSRSDIVKTQTGSAIGWIGRSVPGTNIRIWLKGTPVDLDSYEPWVGQVWGAFPDFFPYPDDDAMGPDLMINPDGAIDFYFIDGNELDPRGGDCGPGSQLSWCFLRRSGGVTIPAAPINGRKTSAYVLINRDTVNLDELIHAIAHELAHVSQFGYDAEEDWWLKDSTADWVAYKVMKKLGRVPRLSYDGAEIFLKGVQLPLNRQTRHNNYHSWLFFLYASTELGNGIVEDVWRKAEGAVDDVQAVDKVIPLEKYFPGFTVRNWNKEQPGPEYKTWDATFRPGLAPAPRHILPVNLATMNLDEPLPRLSAVYYHAEGFEDAVRRITLQNFYATVPDTHVWAIKRIGNDWKPAEDWSRRNTVVLCRDLPMDNVSELVLIVSNSHLTNPVNPQRPPPQVILEDVGCEVVEGTAKATLRLNDPDNDTDMTYVSSVANVRFRPRTVQDTEYNTQYDLLPTSVVWTVAGKKDGCAVDGQAVVDIPSFVDQPLDPTRPAYGYLNVVAKPGGDFHSVEISAINPNARLTKTCPGDPPIVTREPFAVQWLLKILTQPNTHIGDEIIYRGTQTLDPERFQNNLPPEALEVLKNFPQAKELLNRQGGKIVYTFEWELEP